jgi:malic enzyme
MQARTISDGMAMAAAKALAQFAEVRVSTKTPYYSVAQMNYPEVPALRYKWLAPK